MKKKREKKNTGAGSNPSLAITATRGEMVHAFHMTRLIFRRRARHREGPEGRERYLALATSDLFGEFLG